MTKSGDEMESAVEERVARTLRSGVASTPEARERVMRAVRASAPPVRGRGDEVDTGSVSPRLPGRPLWRSPAFGLLAAASVAGAIALVRALGVNGPIPEVPGQRTNVSSRAPAPRTRGPVVAAASAAGSAPPSAPASARAAVAATARAGSARVQFVLVAPRAHHVAVVGDFNDWDTSAAPLTASGGVWSRQVEVPVGRHDYAFVVDGAQWVRDPNAPQAPADEFGSGYSVVVVGESRGEHR